MTGEEGAPKGIGRQTKVFFQISTPLNEKETFLAPKEITVGFLVFGIRGGIM
jgi:hypothetical protein